MPVLEKSAVCSRCGSEYSYRPVMLWGEEVFDTKRCPTCDEAERAERVKEHEANERRNREIKWSQLDLPFRDTDEALLPHKRSRNVLAWQYHAKGFVLHGPSGMGKSRTVMLRMKRLWLDEGRPFEWVTWTDWQSALDKANRYGGGGVAREVHALFKWPVVVFDDALKSKPNEVVAASFFTVLDYRTSRGLPTFITTRYRLARGDGNDFGDRLAGANKFTAEDICRRLIEFSHNAPFDKP
jgi:DNA replication protein DnaC